MLTKHPLTVWRETKGMGQAELARALKVGVWTITSIERGRRKPSPDLAKAISAATGIDRSELRPDLWESAA